MKKWICIISLILTSLFGFGQSGLETKLSKDTIFIGQPAELTLSFIIENIADTSKIVWVLPRDSVASGLAISRTKSQFSETNDGIKVEKVIRFSAEKTGYFPIPPLEARFKGNSFSSEAKLLTVYTTISNPDNEKIRDFKESIKVSYSVLDWLKENWYWIILSLVLLGGLIYAFISLSGIKLKKEKEEIPEPIVIIPPYVIAVKKLDQLQTSKAWEGNNLKEFHSSVSYILREYFEGELEVPALELTSSEIFSNLKKFGLSNDITLKIKTLLSLTDMVKFAKQIPTERENIQVLTNAKEVVDHIYNMKNQALS